MNRRRGRRSISARFRSQARSCGWSRCRPRSSCSVGIGFRNWRWLRRSSCFLKRLRNRMTLSTNDVLNKLLVLHTRSLPVYLSYAQPWQVRNHPRVMEALENIVHLQQDMADRVATLLMENNAQLDFGEFPMHFTGLHDLSVEYVL